MNDAREWLGTSAHRANIVLQSYTDKSCTNHGLQCTGASIKAGSQLPLEELLSIMLAEANPNLRPGFLKVDAIAKWGGLSGPPSRSTLLSMLHAR